MHCNVGPAPSSNTQSVAIRCVGPTPAPVGVSEPRFAMPHSERLRGAWVRQEKEPTPVSYEEFKALVRRAGEARLAQGGLIPIPELRRECRPQIARAEFDGMLTALHAEGHIHLLSHVDSGLLSDSTRADCLHHPSGASLYWIRWL
jgi:hypothetical protein